MGQPPPGPTAKALPARTESHLGLIAYVSDEDYLALPDVQAEFQAIDGGEIFIVRSSPRGAFYGDVPDGKYEAALAKTGYGSKRLSCAIKQGTPIQFRLLSDCVRGYMWPKWVRAGERSEIRVHSAEQYQLTLWRYGRRKEFLRTLGWYDEHGPRTTLQITPDGDYTETGVNWNGEGFAPAGPQQFVVAPELSGLYYVWAKTVGGQTFSFPWVVAPSAPRAQIAVLACTNTWNAYNNFGGRSNYINPGGLPPTPTVNARQELSRYSRPGSVWSIPDSQFKPLSFERPEPGNHIFDNSPWSQTSIEDPMEGRIQAGQAPAEWRLLGWLEQERFAYDYYSEAQLDNGTLNLDAYKMLILSVHPEYWTRRMYDRVERWVRAGGRLVYLGGNGLNCEVVLENDTMRCLSFDDSRDPTSGNESRMHRTFRSEAELLGVAFTHAGVMTAAPYRVINPDHWVFAGTGLRENDSFGEKSLQERVWGGASGHETDKITRSSPKNLTRLAKGTNPDGGGADMVCFDSEQGSVFSVGSITWVACLFSDTNIARITRNVIERFLS